ncbi:transcription elongation regulator 1 [Schistosoma bovis]|uniref:Transcription elongation regulator 1 n=1 Tax=Schistosoma bovis TaxID=6184 RepID=A0A430Q6P3_SCHBO|nr:transcription elongation regulator 1 [Schistosoma bovis]
MNVSENKTPEIQSSKSVTPSLTFDIRKSENLLNNKKLIDTSKTSNLTSTPFLFNKSICIPEEFQQMNVLDVLPYNTPDQCIINHNTDINTTPYTKDIGGISGFLSKAARSVYSRLISSGSSQLALKDTSIVNKPQSIINSSFIESCSLGNKIESIKKEFSIEQEKHQQQSCLNITSSSFVQSEQISQQLLDDEEAWKTIIHEDIDDVSMKSENNSSTSNISRSPLKELLNNIKDVNTTDNNITTNDFDHNNQSCHEHNGITSTTTSTTTTTVPSISSSSPTKSALSISINVNNSVIENLENIEITKQNLRDEITQLKNEADLWK